MEKGDGAWSMIKNLNRSNMTPTGKRIIVLSVLITLMAQAVLIYIGFGHTGSMSQFVEQKQRTNMINHFQQNVMLQLYDINNLLQLLQTPDFSDYFQDNMSLRNEQNVSAKKDDLNNKLNELHLSPDQVRNIYFIGADHNQASLVKEIGTSSIGELTQIRMDMLQNIRLSDMFLKDYNQLVHYTMDDINRYLYKKNIDLKNESSAELNGFLQNLAGNLVISNGNINGVLVVIVLNPNLIHSIFGEKDIGELQYSILAKNGRLVWSTVSDEGLRQIMLTDGTAAFTFQNVHYSNITKELNPFPYRVTVTHREDFSRFPPKKVFDMIILLSMSTLFITFIVSLVYTKKIFQPFRSLAETMKERASSGEFTFKTIEGDTTNRRLRSLSLQRKLTVIFSFAVIVPTISYGIIYYQFLNKSFHNQMDQALSEMADVSKVSLNQNVTYFTHLVNQLSVSRQLQEYLTKREERNATLSPTSSSVSISMFPGLDEVSYFVIYDSSGNCIYSSIFSNNPEIFRIDKDHLKDRTEPYWISGYEDVFKHRSLVMMKPIKHYGSKNDSNMNYLLMVPKESFFEKVGPIDSAFQIYDDKDQLVYKYHSFPDEHKSNLMNWTEKIPDLSWRLLIEYSMDELNEINREYDYRFLVVILIVFFLCISISWVIASYLVKPIDQLKRTMALVGEGDLHQQALYESSNEIGEIIRNYNDMILKLNQTVQENMRIMGENANNKLREKELISMKTRAELRMLQAQINPHFLYNTLEAINMRSMRNGNSEISVMVKALADLFRQSTSLMTDTVPLEVELNHVQNYVSIQQIRLGYSFEFKLEIPAELLGVSVVKFILQPIVENCLKHGIYGYDDGGVIHISVGVQDGMLRLTVKDNGVGMHQEKLDVLNKTIQTEIDEENRDVNPGGIGLSNVYHRLCIFYKEQASLTVNSGPMKGTSVTILLPIANT
jgi:two-component system sensor histidine kinase YesM